MLLQQELKKTPKQTPSKAYTVFLIPFFPPYFINFLSKNMPNKVSISYHCLNQKKSCIEKLNDNQAYLEYQVNDLAYKYISDYNI